jgi:hypothetical protein
LRHHTNPRTGRPDRVREVVAARLWQIAGARCSTVGERITRSDTSGHGPGP